MLLALHRWLGLTLGLVLMSSGLSGALLVAARPLDGWVNAHLHEARGAPLDPRALDAAVERLRGEFPGAELVVRLPRSVGRTVQVDVRDAAWHGQVFLDPAAGTERGRRGEAEGFANALFEWHSALLTDGGGKALLACAGAAGLAVSLLGFVLWWPRSGTWRNALNVRWGVNTTRTVLDLHRAGGALLGLAILVSLASGIYMAWRPLSGWLEDLSGSRTPPAPAVAAGTDGAPAEVSRLMSAAETALPEGRLSIVVLPARNDRAVRVRKQLPDETHPNGLSSVWLDPRSAAVLGVTRWRDGGTGLEGYEYIYPLHIGAIGGTWHRILVALCGLALFALGASGVWIWWKRGHRMGWRERTQNRAAARIHGRRTA